MINRGKKSILLIDDDELVLKTIAGLLEKCGYCVIPYTNPVKAVEESMMQDFDLIISDIRMPEISGIQALRYIREIREKSGKFPLPEILISGYVQDEGDAMSIQPKALIHKPIELLEFMSVVRKVLQ